MIMIWKMIHTLKKVWLRLTIHWPRLIPNTKEKFLELRHLLTEMYDLPKDETTWIIIASHIEGIKPPRLTVSYAYLVAMVQRFYINKMLHEEKLEYYKIVEEHNKQLKSDQEKAETSASGAVINP